MLNRDAPHSDLMQRDAPDAPIQPGHLRKIRLRPYDALLLVDMQVDFLPGGALPALHSQAVLSAANAWLDRFSRHRLPVFASRDWHPADHCSFHAQGGPWPAHCIAGTAGAAFPADLRLPESIRIFGKAKTRERDAYSAFDGTPLQRLLMASDVERLFVGGLATNYCVLHTVRTALDLGYAVFVLTDAIAAVDAHPGDGALALEQMRNQGARLVRLSDLEE